MASNTRWRVSGEIEMAALSLSTRETTVWETPAARATSSWVGRRRVGGALMVLATGSTLLN
jgi:hypothetical protein